MEKQNFMPEKFTLTAKIEHGMWLKSAFLPDLVLNESYNSHKLTKATDTRNKDKLFDSPYDDPSFAIIANEKLLGLTKLIMYVNSLDILCLSTGTP